MKTLSLMRDFKQYNNAFRSPRQRFKSTWCHQYSLRIANHPTKKNDPASSFLVQAYGSLLFLLLSISLTTKLKQIKAGWNDRYLMLTTVLFTLELLSNVYLTQMEKSHVTFLSHYCALKFFTLKYALAHF